MSGFREGIRPFVRYGLTGISGQAIYRVGHELQTKVYKDATLLPKEWSQALDPVMKKVEFELLDSQTSMTSLGMNIFGGSLINAGLSLLEIGLKESQYDGLATITHYARYVAPACLAIANTLIENQQRMLHPYVDNWDADIAMGWLAATMVTAVTIYNDIKSRG